MISSAYLDHCLVATGVQSTGHAQEELLITQLGAGEYHCGWPPAVQQVHHFSSISLTGYLPVSEQLSLELVWQTHISEGQDLRLVDWQQISRNIQTWSVMIVNNN